MYRRSDVEYDPIIGITSHPDCSYDGNLLYLTDADPARDA